MQNFAILTPDWPQHLTPSSVQNRAGRARYPGKPKHTRSVDSSIRLSKWALLSVLQRLSSKCPSEWESFPALRALSRARQVRRAAPGIWPIRENDTIREHLVLGSPGRSSLWGFLSELKPGFPLSVEALPPSFVFDSCSCEKLRFILHLLIVGR
jgi:hypothetical protein